MTSPWNALVADQLTGVQTAELRKLNDDDLPQGEVVVRIAYSSLNYKDGLAVLGQNKVIRQYPMIPGIDFSGTVETSTSVQFQRGDQVVLTGWGVGERHWGGYAQKACVPAQWLLKLPDGISLKQAMSIGTAGLTAMLCAMALRDHGVTPQRGPVVVTGASGGVGSLAVAILAKQGHHVVACTGRAESREYLLGLGAAEMIGRNELAVPAGRPLAGEKWAGAVDVAGGNVLASLLSAMACGSTIAACGLAADAALATTVLPFILRGVTLCGIDSVLCPTAKREEAWRQLVHCLTPAVLDSLTSVIGLRDIEAYSHRILAGTVRGRIVVDVNF